MEVYKNSKNFNKEYKYSIGGKIKEKSFEVLLNIYRANRAKDKTPYINAALDDVKFVTLSEILEDVSVQFEKWGKYSQS